jgi:putative acetyltransferase
MDMKVKLRHETIHDYIGIKTVNDLAFDQPNEGLLIEKLRLNPGFNYKLSIVAEVDGRIVVHILFFPIKIHGDLNIYDSLALAPISVIPAMQNKGIGGQLIKEGLRIAKLLGFNSVIVLGHKDYYPKFGFSPAIQWNIKAPFDLPEGVFMAIELKKDGLKDVSGIVEYPNEFEEVS